ncbi:hypothetical protein GCM10009837_67430 [Streptomyces durmitorensis]
MAVLLLTLVQCGAQTAHAGEQSMARVSAVSRTLPPPEGGPTTEVLDGPESPSGCSVSDPGSVGTAPASVRGLPYASALANPTAPVTPLIAEHLRAVPSRIPGGSHATPAVLCRWLI